MVNNVNKIVNNNKQRKLNNITYKVNNATRTSKQETLYNNVKWNCKQRTKSNSEFLSVNHITQQYPFSWDVQINECWMA